ncbi:TPA: hypothetical protein MIM79_13050 [Klebsiella variicola]|nr:hypothetical protein [Klebsiella variicola]
MGIGTLATLFMPILRCLRQTGIVALGQAARLRSLESLVEPVSPLGFARCSALLGVVAIEIERDVCGVADFLNCAALISLFLFRPMQRQTPIRYLAPTSFVERSKLESRTPSSTKPASSIPGCHRMLQKHVRHRASLPSFGNKQHV